MFRLLIAIATCLLIAACGREPQNHAENAVPPSADSLKNAFIPLFNGVWVMTEYIDEISRTQSPFKSHPKLEGVVAIIAGTEAEGDSMLIDASWNNHEGFSFYVHFTPGRRPHSLPTSIPDLDVPANAYELGYENADGDTIIVLYHFDAGGQLLDKRPFTKIRNYQSDNDFAWGLQYIVNEKLFAGTYHITKGSTTPGAITVNADGTIKGFGKYTNYHISTDFIDAFQNSSDFICFFDNPEQPKGDCFVFEIKDELLYLYQAVPNPETEIEEKGKLVYVLSK